MKKLMKISVIIIFVIVIIVIVDVIGINSWSSKIVKEAYELEDIYINMTQIADGTYEGHSEMGPVIVDVKVTVQDGAIINVEIIKHQNGLGQAANVIVEDMVDKNTYDVDAVSGATVSSEIIKNEIGRAHV